MACSLAAAGADSPGAPEKKTHTLFMGADISVMDKDTALPVRDVENSSFVVNGTGGRTLVRADDPKFRLKLDDTLKLAATRVTVGKLVFDPVFSAGKDPMVKLQDAVRVSAYASSAVSASDADIRWAEAGLGTAQAGLDAVGPNARAELKAPWEAQVNSMGGQLNRATEDLSRNQAMEQMQVLSPVAGSDSLTSELAAAQYDALSVSFELSTPRPLERPYIVIVMHYLGQKDRPDTANVWVYAAQLPLLDEHPRKFNIRRVGFPPGYQIVSYQVHLYDKGTEVATTVSRKQVALTTEEAFDYAVIEYVGDNRDKTKALLKAKAFWPTNLTSRFVPDKLTRTLYVKVGRDGRALGLFEDENCAKPVADAEIVALIPELCFLPALQKGKPVVSIAPIKLGNLN